MPVCRFSTFFIFQVPVFYPLNAGFALSSADFALLCAGFAFFWRKRERLKLPGNPLRAVLWNMLTRSSYGFSCRALRGSLRKSHFIWKATKECLKSKGTKIRVLQVCFQAPFLPPFFPHFSPLFPLQALFTPTTSPLFTSPFIPPFCDS